MSIKKTGITNGVTYSIKYTITATDASDGYIEIDFQSSRDLTYNILVCASNGAVVALTGAVITEPAKGHVRIATGGSFTVTAGYILRVTALADSSINTYEDTGL